MGICIIIDLVGMSGREFHGLRTLSAMLGSGHMASELWLIRLQHGLVDSILRWCLQLQLLCQWSLALVPWLFGLHDRHLTASCHSPVSQARPSVLKITNPDTP